MATWRIAGAPLCPWRGNKGSLWDQTPQYAWRHSALAGAKPGNHWSMSPSLLDIEEWSVLVNDCSVGHAKYVPRYSDVEESGAHAVFFLVQTIFFKLNFQNQTTMVEFKLFIPDYLHWFMSYMVMNVNMTQLTHASACVMHWTIKCTLKASSPLYPTKILVLHSTSASVCPWHGLIYVMDLSVFFCLHQRTYEASTMTNGC